MMKNRFLSTLRLVFLVQLVLQLVSFGSCKNISVPANCYSPLRSVRHHHNQPSTSAATLLDCTTLCNEKPVCVAAEFLEHASEHNCWLYATLPKLQGQGSDTSDWSLCFKDPVVAVPFTCLDNTVIDSRDAVVSSAETIADCQDSCNEQLNSWCVAVTFSLEPGTISTCRLFKTVGPLKTDPSFRSCFKANQTAYIVETAKRKLNTSIYQPESVQTINAVLSALTELDRLNMKVHMSFLITGSAGSGKTTLAVQICDYVVRNLHSFANVEIHRFLRPQVNSLQDFIDGIAESQIIIIDEFLYWTKDTLGQDMLAYLMELITPEPDENQKLLKLVVFTGYEDGYKVMLKYNAGWERRLAEVINIVPLPEVVAKAVLSKLDSLGVTYNTTASEVAESSLFAKLVTRYGFGIVNMIWVEALQEFRDHSQQPLAVSDFETILAAVQRRRNIELMMTRMRMRFAHVL